MSCFARSRSSHVPPLVRNIGRGRDCTVSAWTVSVTERMMLYESGGTSVSTRTFPPGPKPLIGVSP